LLYIVITNNKIFWRGGAKSLQPWPKRTGGGLRAQKLRFKQEIKRTVTISSE